MLEQLRRVLVRGARRTADLIATEAIGMYPVGEFGAARADELRRTHRHPLPADTPGQRDCEL